MTLEVSRGGFATGWAAAGGPLEADEVALTQRLGLPPYRQAIFGYYLTEAGIHELLERLESRRYRVDQPEEAALLTVAWLVRAGDRSAALDLLDVLRPFAGRLRFAPRPGNPPTLPERAVFRRTAGQTIEALRAREYNAAVETQREAIVIWNHLSEQFLELWWRTRSTAGQVASVWPTGWADEAEALVAEYDRLAAVNTRCGKHRNPKENLAILVAATRAQLAGELDPRQRGRLGRSVSDMVAKRGEPGSRQLAGVRLEQYTIAARPAHRDLARLAAARLNAADPQCGVTDLESITRPVTETEGDAWHIDTGYELPEAVSRVVRRSWAAPIETLVAARLIPSAEVLAEIVPQLTADAVAAAAADPELTALVKANYLAFRRRRSLLLLDRQEQVQLDELPWVQAIEPYLVADAGEDGLATALRVARLAVDTFPGTPLPNPLIRELDQLFRSSRGRLPLVEGLAADIFTGELSSDFTTAAKIAGHLLHGSLYARYYDLSYDEVFLLRPARPNLRPWERADWDSFAEQCAGETAYGWGSEKVSTNGQLIERSQFYTTHNLAVLVQAGLRPPQDWLDWAQGAFRVVGQLLDRAVRQRGPLSTVRKAAYAWRQTLFFLAMAPAEVDRFFTFAEREAARYPAVERQLRSVLTGLMYVRAGGEFTDEGTAPGGHRLVGWTPRRHWVLDVAFSSPG